MSHKTLTLFVSNKSLCLWRRNLRTNIFLLLQKFERRHLSHKKRNASSSSIIERNFLKIVCFTTLSTYFMSDTWNIKRNFSIFYGEKSIILWLDSKLKLFCFLYFFMCIVMFILWNLSADALLMLHKIFGEVEKFSF